MLSNFVLFAIFVVKNLFRLWLRHSRAMRFVVTWYLVIAPTIWASVENLC